MKKKNNDVFLLLGQKLTLNGCYDWWMFSAEVVSHTVTTSFTSNLSIFLSITLQLMVLTSGEWSSYPLYQLVSVFN